MPSDIMAAIVMREKRTCQTVCHHITIIFGSDIPMMKPEMIAANKIPEPVAEIQFNPNTAGSAAGLGTTGGTRCTSLLSPVTGICGFVILLGGVLHVLNGVKTFSGVFIIFLPVVVPQQKTMMLRTSHGS